MENVTNYRAPIDQTEEAAAVVQAVPRHRRGMEDLIPGKECRRLLPEIAYRTIPTASLLSPAPQQSRRRRLVDIHSGRGLAKCGCVRRFLYSG